MGSPHRLRLIRITPELGIRFSPLTGRPLSSTEAQFVEEEMGGRLCHNVGGQRVSKRVQLLFWSAQCGWPRGPRALAVCKGAEVCSWPSSERQLGCLSAVCLLYWFPRATGTNDHKLGGLKQQKFILSWFWSLEVWNQGDGRAMLSQGSRRESIPCLSRASGVTSNTWLTATSLQSQSLLSHGLLPVCFWFLFF